MAWTFWMTRAGAVLSLLAAGVTGMGCAAEGGDEAAGDTDDLGGGDPGGSSDTGAAGTAGEPPGPDSGAGGGGAAMPGNDAEIEPGQLTAGQWRDLDQWDFWLDLLDRASTHAYETRWGLHTRERYAVVVEADGQPLVDADVALVSGGLAIWEARTDVLGRAELFTSMYGPAPYGNLSIVVGGQTLATDVEPTTDDPIVLTAQTQIAPEKVLDLMFMIDTTGSMDDELSYLQAELADVVDEVRARAGASFQIRLSVNAYRDENEDYVVREFPFTTDIDQALSDLSAQRASGGGDYPEAVHQALDSAIANHDWSPSATSRLVFLVLDAPPPSDDPDEIGLIQRRVKEAAAQGIRIVPVASSGVDESTEFFLRFIDIATGGTYVFLTDDSGIGDDHIEPTIGEYDVEFLNDLLVGLISASLGV